MKKLLSGLFALLLLLSLPACGGEKDPSPFDPEADTKTLLEAPGTFSGELEELELSTACALYGIEEDTVDSGKVYVGNAGVSLEELAVFVLSDSQAAQEALTALQYHVEDQKEASAGYAGFLGEEIPKLDGAVLEQRGNSVLLAVAADYGPITAFLGE